MIKTTWMGESVWLLNEPPAGLVKLTVQSVRARTTGLTGLATEQALAATVRLSASFDLKLTGSRLSSFLAALRDMMTEPVIWPVWALSVQATVESQLCTAAGGYAQYLPDSDTINLYEATPQNPQSDQLLMPLLWCKIKTVRQRWLGNEVCDLQIELEEWGEKPLSFATTSLPSGPSEVAGGSSPVLADMVGVEEVEYSAELPTTETKLGHSRDQTRITYYPAQVRTLRIRHSTGEIQERLRLHTALLTPRIWLRPYPAAAELAAPAQATDTAITVRDSSAIAAGDNLMISRLFGDGDVICRVQSVNGNTINLTGQLGKAFAVGACVITHLLLSRLPTAQFGMTWKSGHVAEYEADAAEAITEYGETSGEEYGETFGDIVGGCYLYELRWQFGASSGVERWCNRDEDITALGQTWYSGPVSHSGMTRGINLDEDGLTVKLGADKSEIARWITSGKLVLPVTVTVYRRTGQTTYTQEMIGEVTAAEISGREISLTVRTCPSVWDKMVPRIRFQTTCNHALFDAMCGLNSEDWRWTGTVQSVQTSWPYGLTLSSFAKVQGSDPTFWENWFAGGMVQLQTTPPQILPIARSTVPSGGTVTLYLSRRPDPGPAIGSTVSVWAGCDGKAETCKAYNATDNPKGKFNNYTQFGGFPMIPVANPSLFQAGTTAVGGGKK